MSTVFLHGDVDEELYMEQLERFVKQGHEHLYYRLKRSLYGFKQAPRQWYIKFDYFMIEYGFIRCKSDPCVYYKQLPNGEFVILFLYLDDMLVDRTRMRIVHELKKELATIFAMKDLDAAKKILGMTIIHDRQKKEIRLSQKQYIDKVVDRFGMAEAKVVSTPLVGHFRLFSDMCPKTPEDEEFMKGIPYCSAVGSIMYAMVCTCSNIAHAVGVVSKFMNNLGKPH